MDKKLFLDVLNKELVPALGCTEPVAIALAAATAIKYLKGETVIDIKVLASNNIIKNALAVIIPGTGSSGINLAAALGSLSKNQEKCLETQSHHGDRRSELRHEFTIVVHQDAVHVVSVVK